MLEREPQQRVAAGQAEFLADVRAVILNRAMADEEQLGDLFAGLVFGDQLQYAPLGWSQIVETGILLFKRGGPAAAIDEKPAD